MTVLKKICVPILALILIISGIADAAQQKLSRSPKIPGAEGYVNIKKADNNNTKIDLNVKHLADPREIDSSKSAFVVWVAPHRVEDAQNVGALEVDKDLEGSLKTIVPFKEFKLFITAEYSPLVLRPSSDALLWADISRN